jgi:hypothetical protein
MRFRLEKRQQETAEIDQTGRGAHEVLEAAVAGGNHSEVRNRQTEGREENGK